MRKLRFFAALCCTALLFAACEKDEPKTNEAATGTVNGHDWVNLGLPSGTKWATCNVGATNPEEYGNYYAWGETTTKDTYSWDTYKYGTYNDDSDYSKLTKYNTDGLTTLVAADDAATANWGGKWRMPTSAEWAELIDNCEWTWTDDYNGTGVAGRIVASKTNSNTIFLPAAGGRYYDGLYGAGYGGGCWSSTLATNNPYRAWHAGFDSDLVRRDSISRFCGQSVRPVLK